MFWLEVINLIRWISRYWVVWGLFAALYGFSAALLIQPLVSYLLHNDISIRTSFFIMTAMILLSAFLSLIPGYKVLSLGSRTLKGVGSLFLLHQLRSLRFWSMIAVLALAYSYCKTQVEWILLSQIGVQVFLIRGYQWIEMAYWLDPKKGSISYLRGVQATFLLQSVVAMFIGCLFTSLAEPWMLLLPGLAAVGAACSVALEGDAGRPLLVNFMALTAGCLGGVLTLLWWPTIFFVIYFGVQMGGVVKNRLRSVRHWSEDVILS